MRDGATAPIIIRIGAELTIDGLPAGGTSHLMAANTFRNPAFVARQRRRLWTGGMSPTIVTYRHTPAGLVLPRGVLPMVIGLCRDHRLPCQIEDATICPPLNVALAPGVLRGYQARALADLLRHSCGQLVAPCGGGKTNIALSVIAHLQTPTLIGVHTDQLLQQTRDRCRQWLGIEPGTIGGGVWHVQPITIAMVQSLASRGVHELVNYFGAIVIDECHHCPAQTWARVLNEFPARFKFGLTATPTRKDGLHILTVGTLGPVIATITEAEVVAGGAVLVPAVETVFTTFRYDLRGSTGWGQMITALVSDASRNGLIAHEVRARMQPGRRALVLTDRVDHAHHLAAALSDLTPVLLTGALTKSSRDTAMTAARAGTALTIATTSLLGEGIDLPSMDVLLLVCPMAGGSRTTQAVGRVCRTAPGKRAATVIDFVDHLVPALMAAHRQRQRLYPAAEGAQ